MHDAPFSFFFFRLLPLLSRSVFCHYLSIFVNTYIQYRLKRMNSFINAIYMGYSLKTIHKSNRKSNEQELEQS